MGEEKINVNEYLCEYQMSGYYNNTCRVENLLVNSKSDFKDKYISKFTGHQPNISYPARFEPIDKSEF